MANDDEQTIRELERALESALDEESISEMLDGFASEARESSEAIEEIEVELLGRDSEAIIGSAPSSEATEEPPTIEAYIGEAPDDHMPEAAVVMRRRRKDAGQYPVQPPPLPKGVGRGSKRGKQAPSNRPHIPEPSRPASVAGDLRPADRRAEKIWDLDETPLSAVLLELVTRPGLGLVQVRTGRRRAQMVIEDGQVFEIRLLPASAKRSLSAFLQRAKKITADSAEQIRRRAKRSGVCEATALLQEPDLVSPGVVRSGVCSRTRYLLRRLLEAPLSRAEFYPLEDASAASMIVSVPLVGILFAHARASHSAKFSGRRDRARERFRHMQVCRKPSFAFSVNQLGLELYERQLVDRVLGEVRSFEEVLRDSPLPQDDTIAVLVALETVGLLEVEPPGLSGLEGTSSVEDYAASLERIELMEARLERENLFAIFGLHWTSYDGEVARSYREMSRLFAPDNLPLGLSSEERARVEGVRERLEAIHARLIDSKERELYRRKLIGDTTRVKTAKKLESLADAALRRKALHSALDYYQRLHEIEPQHERARKVLPVLIARTNRRGR